MLNNAIKKEKKMDMQKAATVCIVNSHSHQAIHVSSRGNYHQGMRHCRSCHRRHQSLKTKVSVTANADAEPGPWRSSQAESCAEEAEEIKTSTSRTSGDLNDDKPVNVLWRGRGGGGRLISDKGGEPEGLRGWCSLKPGPRFACDVWGRVGG